MTVRTESDLRSLNQIVAVLACRNMIIDRLTLARAPGGECMYTIGMEAEEQCIDALVGQIKKKIGVLKVSTRVDK
jgi:acetolactate synthase small subunit